jgi:hypothetical protein
MTYSPDDLAQIKSILRDHPFMMAVIKPLILLDRIVDYPIESIDDLTAAFDHVKRGELPEVAIQFSRDVPEYCFPIRDIDDLIACFTYALQVPISAYPVPLESGAPPERGTIELSPRFESNPARLPDSFISPAKLEAMLASQSEHGRQDG